MPITIPASFPDASPFKNLVDPTTGSTLQAVNTSPPALCYYDPLTDACATLAQTGIRKSITINDAENCSRGFRFAQSAKNTGVADFFSSIPYDAFDDWLTAIAEDYENFNPVNPPTGFTLVNGVFRASAVPVTIGTKDYLLTPTVAIANVSTVKQCVTPDPNNPVCTLEELVKVGSSITATAVEIGTCVTLQVYATSVKSTFSASKYEDGDYDIVETFLRT